LTMGLVGLFVGPVVLAVTWRLFEAWAGLYVPSTAAAAVSAPVVVEGAVGESTAATSAAGSPAAQVAIAANNEPAPVAPVAPHGTPTA
jgi:hypothetical protein